MTITSFNTTAPAPVGYGAASIAHEISRKQTRVDSDSSSLDTDTAVSDHLKLDSLPTTAAYQDPRYTGLNRAQRRALEREEARAAKSRLRLGHRGGRHVESYPLDNFLDDVSSGFGSVYDGISSGLSTIYSSIDTLLEMGRGLLWSKELSTAKHGGRTLQVAPPLPSPSNSPSSSTPPSATASPSPSGPPVIGQISPSPLPFPSSSPTASPSRSATSPSPTPTSTPQTPLCKINGTLYERLEIYGRQFFGNDTHNISHPIVVPADASLYVLPQLPTVRNVPFPLVDRTSQGCSFEGIVQTNATDGSGLFCTLINGVATPYQGLLFVENSQELIHLKDGLIAEVQEALTEEQCARSEPSSRDGGGGGIPGGTVAGAVVATAVGAGLLGFGAGRFRRL